MFHCCFTVGFLDLSNLFVLVLKRSFSGPIERGCLGFVLRVVLGPDLGCFKAVFEIVLGVDLEIDFDFNLETQHHLFYSVAKTYVFRLAKARL